MHEIEQAFARLKGAWMTGGSAVKHAPDAWQQLIDGIDAGEAERRLVALAGQAAQLVFEATPSSELTSAQDLSRLDKPALPDSVRPRFRRLFAAPRTAGGQGDLLAFVSQRGYVVHPADWMPKPDDDTAPADYIPWVTWQLARTSEGPDHLDSLDEDSWDYYSPAERRTELTAIRRRDPAAARELIAAKAASLAADQRYRVIEILAGGLSEQDTQFLETLLGDRSGKVKTLATALLARLGHAAEPGELEAELADFMSLGKKGILSRKLKVGARKLKTDAQRQRREELHQLVSLKGLSDALELAPEELLTAWDFGTDARATQGLTAMIAATASDDHLSSFAGQLVDHRADLMPMLADRLPSDERTRHATTMLQDPNTGLANIAACLGDRFGEMSKDQLTSAPVVNDLIRAIAKFSDEEPSSSRTRRENAAGEELYQLGFLADADAAAALNLMMVDAGLMAIDPKLDMLRFNELLPPRQDDAK